MLYTREKFIYNKNTKVISLGGNMDIFSTIKEIKIVPVVVFNNVSETVPTLTAMMEGGLPVAEICYRTDCAPECLKLAVKEFKDKFVIGAGTVINAKQAKEAISLGAQFIVSPGLSEAVAEVCKEANIPYFPGVATPTEIMAALELGINIVKFFPASVYGGIKAINAIGAAFPQVKFLPTGGVGPENLVEFLTNKKIFACGGSWMMKGTPEEIKNKCIEAMNIVKGVQSNG